MVKGTVHKAMKKDPKRERVEVQDPRRGDAAHEVLKKKWANSTKMRRDFGKGKKT